MSGEPGPGLGLGFGFGSGEGEWVGSRMVCGRLRGLVVHTAWIVGLWVLNQPDRGAVGGIAAC